MSCTLRHQCWGQGDLGAALQPSYKINAESNFRLQPRWWWRANQTLPSSTGTRERERYIFLKSLQLYIYICQIIFENIQTKTETGSHDQWWSSSSDTRILLVEFLSWHFLISWWYRFCVTRGEMPLYSSKVLRYFLKNLAEKKEFNFEFVVGFGADKVGQMDTRG